MKTRKPPKKKSRSSAEEDRFYTAECLYVLRTTWERLGGGGQPHCPISNPKNGLFRCKFDTIIEKISNNFAQKS